MPPQTAGVLRSDAERNRRAIIAAATEAFRDKGLDVSVDEIARRAGVGSATLYRRFPTRADLLAAAVEERVAAYADLVDRALEAPDPWVGFADLLRSLCDLQAQDAGLRDLLAVTGWDLPTQGDNARRALRGLEAVVVRAQAHGSLRRDFRVDDVTTVFMANAGIISAGAAAPPDARHRHLDYLIGAFATRPRSDAPVTRRRGTAARRPGG